MYVVQVLAGDEMGFLERCRRNISELADALILPRRQLRIRRNGRWTRQVRPIFPGYVFLDTPDADDGLWRRLGGVRGFIRPLHSSEDVRALPPRDEQAIRNLIRFGSLVRPSRVRFNENDRIEVIDGPLAGMEGQIVRVDRRKGRARVKLDLYKDSFSIDLGIELVTAAGAVARP